MPSLNCSLEAMKKLRAIIYLLVFLIGASLLIYFLANLINTKLDNRVDQAQPQLGNLPIDQAVQTDQSASQNGEKLNTAILEKDSAQSTNSIAPAITPVTTIKLASLDSTYVETLGTVKSNGAITLFPSTAATVKKINFQEGDYVQAGDIIVELTGNNFSQHPSETQLKIAEQTLVNARDSLVSLQKTSNETLQTAALQLQSAYNQSAALAYDLAVIEQNKAGLEDTLSILQDSLNNTREKNNRDQLKGRRDIDDLIFTLNAAQDARSTTQRQINDLEEQIENLQNNSPATNMSGDDVGSINQGATANTSSNDVASLQEKLAKLQSALDAQDKGIEELYAALDQSQFGLNTAENGAEIGENQVLAQIIQSQNQASVLDLNLQSTKTKLGYTGDSTDALQMAQQAYNSTRVQLQTALDNAANQVKLAELNVALARSQADGLTIRAPFSGIITMLDLYAGQSVNPQSAVAEVIDPRGFELEIGVDAATADRISAGSPAQITLAGRAIPVPIRSVGLKVDERTRLVKVTLALPNIFFKINQNLSARLPLSTGGSVSGSHFLPLDAVTIGTESQFVYVIDQGKAKKVQVKIGAIAGDQIEILGGLEPDAEVIVGGAKELIDGQAVTVNNLPAQA